MQFRRVLEVLFEQGDGHGPPRDEGGPAASQASSLRAQAAGMGGPSPAQMAWSAGALGVMGCFMAPLAPFAWWLGARARARLGALDRPNENAAQAAKWGHWLGRIVTVIAGAGLFLWLVGSLS